MEQPRRSSIPVLGKIFVERLDRIANRQLATFDITSSQARALIVLSEHAEGTMTLKELERLFCVTQQSMAGIVARLERKGYVRGETTALGGRRHKTVRLTEHGRRIVGKVNAMRSGVDAELLSCLTPEEQQTLESLLKKLCDGTAPQRECACPGHIDACAGSHRAPLCELDLEQETL